MPRDHHRGGAAPLLAGRPLPPACACGLPPLVGVSKSAKNPGRAYASCARWPRDGHCSWFRWVEVGPTAAAAAPSSSASAAAPAADAGPRTPEQAPGRARSAGAPIAAKLSPAPAAAASSASAVAAAAAPASTRAAAAAAAAEPESAERFAAFLLVAPAEAPAPVLLLPASAAAAPAQPAERVRLLLLPAMAHTPAHCTQHLAVATSEGRLPRAPAALRSLQPPYVQVQHCAAARGLAAALGCPAGGGGTGGGTGGVFVLDCETTGLSGEPPGLGGPERARCPALLRRAGSRGSCRPGCTPGRAAWRGLLPTPRLAVEGALGPPFFAS